MSQPTLRAVYQELEPRADTVFIIPDMEKFSRFNPYLQLLYSDLNQGDATSLQVSSSSILNPLKLFRPGGRRTIVHHHWFECRDLITMVNALWKIFWLGLFRLAGGKVVWTIHNRRPHEQNFAFLNQILRRIWSKLPHRYHLHCQAAISIMVKELNIQAERCFVVPHPAYPARPVGRQTGVDLLHSKYQLDISNMARPVFMMFGSIAPYKGIDEVAALFAEQRIPGTLLIAGRVKGQPGSASRLRTLAANGENIRLLLQMIPEEDVPGFMAAADVLLFNYRDILTSGGVALAQSYGKRVIVPLKGCLAETALPNGKCFRTKAELLHLLQKEAQEWQAP